MNQTNPCLGCGACCACFRVSFHWLEAEAGVPRDLARELYLHRLVMLGTDVGFPRCAALDGTIGVSVRCAIYEHRPSVCREFLPARKDDDPTNSCDRVRAHHGLPPLRVALEDWREDPPENVPPLPRAA